MPRFAKASATALLRGLWRLEPLPCAKTTRELAVRGMRSVPAKPSGGIETSVTATPSMVDTSDLPSGHARLSTKSRSEMLIDVK